MPQRVCLTTTPSQAGVVQAVSEPINGASGNLGSVLHLELGSTSLSDRPLGGLRVDSLFGAGLHVAGRLATGWLESWTLFGAGLHAAGRLATGWLGNWTQFGL